MRYGVVCITRQSHIQKLSPTSAMRLPGGCFPRNWAIRGHGLNLVSLKCAAISEYTLCTCSFSTSISLERSKGHTDEIKMKALRLASRSELAYSQCAVCYSITSHPIVSSAAAYSSRPILPANKCMSTAVHPKITTHHSIVSRDKDPRWEGE